MRRMKPKKEIKGIKKYQFLCDSIPAFNGDYVKIVNIKEFYALPETERFMVFALLHYMNHMGSNHTRHITYLGLKVNSVKEDLDKKLQTLKRLKSLSEKFLEPISKTENDRI